MFKFDPAGADIDLRIAWPLIAGAAATSALLSVGALGLAMKARQRAVVTGAEEMIGSTGTVIDWQEGKGRIRIHGEVWAARGPERAERGRKVRVAARDGLTLTVDNAE